MLKSGAVGCTNAGWDAAKGAKIAAVGAKVFWGNFLLEFYSIVLMVIPEQQP